MWLPLVLACRRDDAPTGETDPTPAGPDSGTGHTAAATSTAHTGSTAGTASTGHTGTEPLVYDCDDLPTTWVSVTEIAGPRGYHDLAFMDDGGVLGTTVGGDLARGDYYGGLQIAVPRTGALEQMTWLADGDLAVASGVGILRIASNGSVTTINPNIRPYGLVLGPDGRLWAADQRSIWALDPVTGVEEELLAPGLLDRGSPRVIQFDLDYTHLYIGTYQGSEGRIYRLPLGPDWRPTGPPTVFATGVGRGGYHDAIGIDICGYLYVPDYDTSALYRVSPAADVQVLFDSVGLLRRDYGHGLEWGSGLGGFKDDAIYLPQPYDGNRVLELVIGVPSREWTGGTAIHQP